jgi:hypothetical protein
MTTPVAVRTSPARIQRQDGLRSDALALDTVSALAADSAPAVRSWAPGMALGDGARGASLVDALGVSTAEAGGGDSAATGTVLDGDGGRLLPVGKGVLSPPGWVVGEGDSAVDGVTEADGVPSAGSPVGVSEAGDSGVSVASGGGCVGLGVSGGIVGSAVGGVTGTWLGVGVGMVWFGGLA